LVAAILAVSVLTAMLAALRAHRQIQEQLQGIAGTLAQSDFPLRENVLRQMRGLSGAEFVCTDDTERFLRRWSATNQSNQPTSHLMPETVRELCGREWPGNVRELRNAIEHGALLARGGAIAPEHLPPPTFLGEAATDPARLLHETVRA
jgi:transcriptional regulator of aromatic amino acid metabolism